MFFSVGFRFGLSVPRHSPHHSRRTEHSLPVVPVPVVVSLTPRLMKASFGEDPVSIRAIHNGVDGAAFVLCSSLNTTKPWQPWC
jgi:hypothetical protein